VTQEGQNVRLFSLLLILAFVGVCFGAERKPGATSQGKEPIYEEKTLSEWVALAKEKNPALRMEAAAHWGTLGPQGFQALTKLLKDKDSEVRQAALDAVKDIGPEAKIAIPALMELLKDKDVQWDVVSALKEIGPAAIPTLMELLKRQEHLF